MNPTDPVEVADRSHVLGKFLGLWPLEALINDRDYVAVRLQCSNDFLQRHASRESKTLHHATQPGKSDIGTSSTII